MSCCSVIGSVVGNSGGGGGGGGGGGKSAYAPPEQWVRNRPIPPGLVDEPLSGQVSTSFDDWEAINAGSVVGLGVRFTSLITDGTAIIQITINGVPAVGLELVCTSGSNPTGGVVTVAAGTIPYAATDLIGVMITTSEAPDPDFAPVDNDVEVQIKVQDA
jgi:hypothetical protein